MALPYFPLYPKDLFSDDRFTQMTPYQQGLWLILLSKMWVNDNQLQDDDKKISKMLRVSHAVWSGLKKELLESGLLIPCDGILRNNRLTVEYERAISKSEQARNAVNKRHGKEMSDHEKLVREQAANLRQL